MEKKKHINIGTIKPQKKFSILILNDQEDNDFIQIKEKSCSCMTITLSAKECAIQMDIQPLPTFLNETHKGYDIDKYIRIQHQDQSITHFVIKGFVENEFFI